jgi:SET domain-containing protein
MKIIIKQSKITGKGLFAARNIKKGEVVIAWHPKILSDEEFARLPTSQLHYVITDNKQKLLMQAPERYVNHSCDPNTKPINRSDIALRDIDTGEEITSDYLDENSVLFVCHCGAANCRSQSSE